MAGSHQVESRKSEESTQLQPHFGSSWVFKLLSCNHGCKGLVSGKVSP